MLIARAHKTRDIKIDLHLLADYVKYLFTRSCNPFLALTVALPLPACTLVVGDLSEFQYYYQTQFYGILMLLHSRKRTSS